MKPKNWSYYYFRPKQLHLPEKWTLLRKVGKQKLSAKAQEKLEWIIFYHTIGNKKAKQTAQYFGITRKTVHKWLARFDEGNILSLEEVSRAPQTKRAWMVTETQEEQIMQLRKQYITLGKKKFKTLYKSEYGENISTWKIQRVIRKHQLYQDQLQHIRPLAQRHKHPPKKRIHTIRKEQTFTQFGQLWHVDAIIIWWYGEGRIIFTAIDEVTRIAYARCYRTNTTSFATDFLKRLVALSNGAISLLHSDNGSEFDGLFKESCKRLKIPQVYSRAYTPKDNALLERFNRTVQEEWLEFSVQGLDDIQIANQELTDWLIFYNTRPHQALDYKTPLQYAQDNFFKVSPMWSASTGY